MMKRLGLGTIFALLASPLCAQDWQAYQLTHYVSPDNVRQCGAVADTFGNLHHYFIQTGTPAQPDQPNRIYYLRTDFYGHILTDTVRLNGFIGFNSAPLFSCVVGDGAHAWCTYGDYRPIKGWYRGLYLTERDAQGVQVFSPRVMGRGGGTSGPPSWDLATVLRTQDSTIHAVGNVSPYYYYRYTTSGDSIIWRRPIDGLNIGVDPKIHLGPDGAVWAAMRNDVAHLDDTEILLVRFGEDTSQTVYRPFAGTVRHWFVYDFGIDTSYNFHFLVASDTADVAYYRLDSALAIQEAHVLEPDCGAFATIKPDALGNCLIVWDLYPGLKWAFRRADGTWPVPATVINSAMGAASFSIVTVDSQRFAFTAQCNIPIGSYSTQLYLFTYGFPPDAVPAPRAVSPTPTVSTYPNPFSSSLTINLPATQAQALALYDLLGRVVWTQAVPAQARTVWLSDPRLSALPSGSYFLSLEGNSAAKPARITHFK